MAARMTNTPRFPAMPVFEPAAPLVIVFYENGGVYVREPWASIMYNPGEYTE